MFCEGGTSEQEDDGCLAVNQEAGRKVTEGYSRVRSANSQQQNLSAFLRLCLSDWLMGAYLLGLQLLI